MKTELLGLYAETSIHAGANGSTSVIDLPIMREAHTGWPCVFGSAMKGAMRAKAEKRDKAEKNELEESLLNIVFGPSSTEHAGAVAVGDARLLLLPVRSLTSHFKWVTCPSLLRRAFNDAKRVGKATPDAVLKTIDAAGLTEDSALQVGKAGVLYLEEFQCKTQQTDLAALVTWLAGFVPTEEDFADRLNNQLVIVHDDLFAHLAQHATPVSPHIAINNETKTVVGGMLWYEETLPPETLMYLTVAANNSRNKELKIAADEVLDSLLSLFPESAPYLQIGGNETVGMGWCRVSAVKGA